MGKSQERIRVYSCDSWAKETFHAWSHVSHTPATSSRRSHSDLWRECGERGPAARRACQALSFARLAGGDPEKLVAQSLALCARRIGAVWQPPPQPRPELPLGPGRLAGQGGTGVKGAAGGWTLERIWPVGPQACCGASKPTVSGDSMEIWRTAPVVWLRATGPQGTALGSASLLETAAGESHSTETDARLGAPARLALAAAGVSIRVDARQIPEDFLDGFRNRDSASMDCRACGYCDRIAAQAVTISADYRTEVLRNTRKWTIPWQQEGFGVYEFFMICTPNEPSLK